jgi:predicted restriction endonuclease
MNRPELLLHPNIPKPLHGMSPRELKGTEWWDKTRQQVYEKANYKCQCCGVDRRDAKYHKWLEAHECYIYDYERGTATVSEIIALCHSCHSYIHSGLLQMRYRSGQISLDKYLDIKNHGDNILRKSGLTLPPPPSKIADWEKWRIILDGVEYPTKYKSYEAWFQHYNK